MPEIKKVNKSMFDKVHLLLSGMEGTLTKEDWRPLFSFPWKCGENYLGYALVDRNNVVGFMGLLFSKRVVDGELKNFCNITSWIVKKEYRNYNIGLILDLRNLKGYTITNLTPSQEVHNMLSNLGFKPLETTISILPLVADYPKLIFGIPYKITTYNKEIKERLLESDLNIFNDHDLPLCQHILLYNTQDYCYVIYKKIKRRRLFFNKILFISNAAVFAKNINKILFKLFLVNQTIFSLVDTRILRKEQIRFSIKHKLQRSRLFKSETLVKDQIDNLYSEFALLPI